MLTAFRKRLVEALRSGKYKQGYGRLKKGDCFCVLGIICDLNDPTQWKDEPGNWTTYGPGGYLASLPKDVAVGLDVSRPEEGHLIAMNDGQRLTFEQIADKVEAWT